MNPDILAGLVARAIDMAKKPPKTNMRASPRKIACSPVQFRTSTAMMGKTPILRICAQRRLNAKMPRAPFPASPTAKAQAQVPRVRSLRWPPAMALQA
jgi:hypothetical protein